jgi:hypothetical protein
VVGWFCAGSSRVLKLPLLKDETVQKLAGVIERSDDLAAVVDAVRKSAFSVVWSASDRRGIVDRGEDIDWHCLALLTAYGRHQHYHLAIRGRRTIRADLTGAAAVFDRRSHGVQKMMGYSKSKL